MNRATSSPPQISTFRKVNGVRGTQIGLRDSLQVGLNTPGQDTPK